MKNQTILTAISAFCTLFFTACADTSSHPSAARLHHKAVTATAPTPTPTPTPLPTVAEPVVAQFQPVIESTPGPIVEVHPPPAPPQFTKNLYIGCSGPEVVRWQERMVEEDYLEMPEGVSMGKFGLLTEAATVKFQKKHHISPDGYFGPITRAIANTINQTVKKDTSFESTYSAIPYKWALYPAHSLIVKAGGSSKSLKEIRNLMEKIHYGPKVDPRKWLNRIPPESLKTLNKPKYGNCLGKSLELLDSINDSTAKFMTGKYRNRYRMSGWDGYVLGPDIKLPHTWIYWQQNGKGYILDCELNAAPISMGDAEATNYIPYGVADRRGVHKAQDDERLLASAKVALK